MKNAVPNPSAQMDERTEVLGPEEQKAESERRKEKLMLIYNAARELKTFLDEAQVVNSAKLSYSFDPQFSHKPHGKERTARMAELIRLGEQLEFIVPAEFLETSKDEALKNLAELINEIEQDLIPELGMKNLTTQVETVLEGRKEVKTSLRVA